MKYKLTLSKVKELKDKLENGIYSDNKDIQKWNSIKAKEKREIDIKTIRILKDKKSQLLVEIYLLLQEANLKSSPEDTKPNAYYIKQLSEFKREKEMLMSLNTTDGLVKDKSRTIKHEAFIKSSEVTENLRYLESKIQKIEQKLNLFNNTQTITIDIDSDLEYLLK